MRRLFLFLTTSICLTMGAHAAPLIDTTDLCPDIPIVVLDNRNVDAAAQTNDSTGEKRILIGRPFMQEFTPAAQRFIIYHECAHHHGADSSSDNSRSIKHYEKLADQMATDRAHEEGWLNEQAIKEICNTWTYREKRRGRLITRWEPETSTHPGGQARCNSLKLRYHELESRKQTS